MRGEREGEGGRDNRKLGKREGERGKGTDRQRTDLSRELRQRRGKAS